MKYEKLEKLILFYNFIVVLFAIGGLYLCKDVWLPLLDLLSVF